MFLGHLQNPSKRPHRESCMAFWLSHQHCRLQVFFELQCCSAVLRILKPVEPWSLTRVDGAWWVTGKTTATTVNFTHLEVVSAAVWKLLMTSTTNGIWNKDLPIWHPMFNPFRSVYPGRQPALKPVQQWKQLLDIFQGPLILVEPEMILQDT